jgi:hypothetical protein
MCWNSEVSLNTFIFGIISAIIVWRLNVVEKLTILIILSITLMQLLEYFTWKNLRNSKINYYLSIIGLIIIFTQIILIIINTLNIKYISILLLLLIFFIILYFLTDFRNENLRMDIGSNKHLVWYWLDIPIYWIIIGLSFYLIPIYLRYGIFSFAFLGVNSILIPSLYYYYKYKTWGTLWCYYSNLFWIYLLIISIYLYLKKNNY